VFQTPDQKAWKLLDGLLSAEQKWQAQAHWQIVERGVFGYYTIPLHRGFVNFKPHEGQFRNFLAHAWRTRSLRDWELLPVIMVEQTICMRYTGQDCPWYDSVATFLLHIRARNEGEFFRKGNLMGR
jgi:hypothetical protein